MASSTIQQKDVDEAKKQQQLQQSPQKFDKLGGLSRMFAQNQSATPKQPLPTAKANAQQGVTQAQNTANTATQQAGSAVKAKTDTRLTPYIVNPQAPQAKNFGTGGDTSNALMTNIDYVKMYQDPNRNAVGYSGEDPATWLTSGIDWDKRGAGVQVKIGNDYAEGTNKLNDFNTAQTQAIDNVVNPLSEELAADATRQGLGDLGTKTDTQLASAGLNQALAQEGPALGAGKLAALFGKGYDSEKYGALDSQIYNKELQDATREAQKNLKGAASAESGKTAAKEQYDKDVKEAQKKTGDYSTKSKETLKKQVETDQKELDRLRDEDTFKVGEGVKSKKEAEAKKLADYKKAMENIDWSGVLDMSNLGLNITPESITNDLNNGRTQNKYNGSQTFQDMTNPMLNPIEHIQAASDGTVNNLEKLGDWLAGK